MKKTYEKPKIEAVTYAANTSLCGSCADILNEDVVDDIINLLEIFGEDEMRAEFDGHWYDRSYNFFADSEGCNPAIVDVGYCKFTAGNTQLYLS